MELFPARNRRISAMSLAVLVLEALSQTPRHIDQVSQQAGIPATEAGIEIILLELEGLVRRLPGSTCIRMADQESQHFTVHLESKLTEKLPGELLFVLKAARPGFWSTAVWFYLLPVGQRDMFGTPAFWLGLLYCTFPLGLLLYGWNDLADIVTDRLNPRKNSLIFGARGTDAQLARLPLLIAVVQTPFIGTFVWLLGPKALAWFGAVLLVNWLYNRPRFPFKSHAPLDMLNQAGYLLVFPLSSWLNGVPQLPWATFVFSALFAMHSHLFGQIMDLVPDKAAGRRTTAICLGMVRAKVLLVLMLTCETAFVAWAFKNFFFTLAMALGTLWILFDLVVLFRSRLYPTYAVFLFAIGLNVAMFSTMHWMWQTGALLHMR